jgi:hypothetical protein
VSAIRGLVPITQHFNLTYHDTWQKHLPQMKAPFVCRRSLQIVEEFSMQQDAFKYKGKNLAELYV